MGAIPTKSPVRFHGLGQVSVAEAVVAMTAMRRAMNKQTEEHLEW